MTLFSTAPAHPHATGVAMYPALFSLKEVDIYSQRSEGEKKFIIWNSGVITKRWKKKVPLSPRIMEWRLTEAETKIVKNEKKNWKQMTKEERISARNGFGKFLKDYEKNGKKTKNS